MSKKNLYLEKHIHKLPLRECFGDRESVRKEMLSRFGSYDKKHYKKYWLDHDMDTCFSDENAYYLALYELTKAEMDEIRSRDTLIQMERIDNPSKHFQSTVSCSFFFDFEEEKYDYYEVTEDIKHSPSCFSYSIRVLSEHQS